MLQVAIILGLFYLGNCFSLYYLFLHKFYKAIKFLFKNIATATNVELLYLIKKFARQNFIYLFEKNSNYHEKLYTSFTKLNSDSC